MRNVKEKIKINLKVNGEDVTYEINPEDSLLKALRANYNYDVKDGCEIGECGAEAACDCADDRSEEHAENENHAVAEVGIAERDRELEHTRRDTYERNAERCDCNCFAALHVSPCPCRIDGAGGNSSFL